MHWLLLFFFPKTAHILALEKRVDELEAQNRKLVDALCERQGVRPVFERLEPAPLQPIKPAADEFEAWRVEDEQLVNRQLVERAAADPRMLDYLRELSLSGETPEARELYQEARGRIEEMRRRSQQLESTEFQGEVN